MLVQQLMFQMDGNNKKKISIHMQNSLNPLLVVRTPYVGE